MSTTTVKNPLEGVMVMKTIMRPKIGANGQVMKNANGKIIEEAQTVFVNAKKNSNERQKALEKRILEREGHLRGRGNAMFEGGKGKRKTRKASKKSRKAKKTRKH